MALQTCSSAFLFSFMFSGSLSSLLGQMESSLKEHFALGQGQDLGNCQIEKCMYLTKKKLLFSVLCSNEICSR